jgi:hypothetical protein
MHGVAFAALFHLLLKLWVTPGHSSVHAFQIPWNDLPKGRGSCSTEPWMLEAFIKLHLIEKTMLPLSTEGVSSLFQTDTRKISAVSVYFETMPYRLDEKTGYIDYDTLEANAKLFRPKILIAGSSASSRSIDYARMRKVGF